MPLALELFGAAGEGPADLVLDLVEVFGCAERTKGHGVEIPGEKSILHSV